VSDRTTTVLVSPLIAQLGVVLADEVAADARLEVGEDAGQLLLAHLLELTEDTGLEEDLGVSDTIVVAEIQRRQHLLRCHFAVHEAGRNGVRSENRVAVDSNENNSLTLRTDVLHITKTFL